MTNLTYALVNHAGEVVYIGDEEDKRNSENNLTWVPLIDAHVKVGYSYCFRSRTFHRVRKPIEVERQQTQERINSVFNSRMKALLSGFDEYEIMTFPFQVMALFEKTMNVDGLCQAFLAGLSTGRRETKDETAKAIDHATRNFLFVAGLMVGSRHTFEKMANNVQTHDQIDELHEQIDIWERSPLIPTGAIA